MEARPILVTPDAAFIGAVNSAVQAQLATLTTNAMAIPAVEKGFAVLVADLDEAVKVSDRIAPEHLEIQTADAQVAAAPPPRRRRRASRATPYHRSCSRATSIFVVVKARSISYNTRPFKQSPTPGRITSYLVHRSSGMYASYK